MIGGKNLGIEFIAVFFTVMIAVRYLDAESLINLETLTQLPPTSASITYFELLVTTLCTSPMIFLGRRDTFVTGVVQGCIAWIVCYYLQIEGVLLFELPLESYIIFVFYFSIFLPLLTQSIFSLKRAASPVSGHQRPRETPRERREQQRWRRLGRAQEQRERESYREPEMSRNMLETFETGETPLLPQPSRRMKTRAEILLERIKEEDKT